MKHIHQNQEFRFNEVLFEHRNKEYGAYVLRNESDRILTKALFVGVSLLAAISLTPILINAFKSTETIERGTIFTLPPPVDVDRPDTPPPATVVPPTAASAPVKTFDNTVPTPTAHVTNEKVVEKIEGAVAGTKNNSDGEIAPPNTYVPTTSTIGTGPVINTTPPTVVPKEDPNVIVDSKDLGVEASFVGGVDSFRNKVMNNFDGSGFDSGDVMKTTITFIVEKDGTISGIKANGADADFNNEAVRTIKSIRGKWVPAKNKQGDPVRSYFKFPISMKFDN
ncbi:protein TonB [Chryseobacterium sp. RU37D]|uniref:energy transducer TonB n=1 Tax=Chryseobacterium sp. RU37D TaxID=1907397 RepID=UPI00095706C2|nr:hypothetical protein [Chryseobacterium sp. RU37D]SIQ90099.1 protein TonB [Chryseobacterium sp. RU37D]